MEGKREVEGKRVMAIIAIMAMSLLFFTACSSAAKETKSETRWDDMEQQIKDVIQKEEIWDRGGFADTELLENTIVKIIPGSFSGPDRDELLVQSQLVNEEWKQDLWIASVFDTETGEIITAKGFPMKEMSLYALPVKGDSDRIFYIGETSNQGWSHTVLQLWKLDGTEWQEMDVPEIPENFAEENRTVTAEMNTRGELMIMSERIEGAATNTGEFQITFYCWTDEEGKFWLFR